MSLYILITILVIVSDLYKAFTMNMFICTLQESTEFRIDH